MASFRSASRYPLGPSGPSGPPGPSGSTGPRRPNAAAPYQTENTQTPYSSVPGSRPGPRPGPRPTVSSRLPQIAAAAAPSSSSSITTAAPPRRIPTRPPLTHQSQPWAPLLGSSHPASRTGPGTSHPDSFSRTSRAATAAAPSGSSAPPASSSTTLLRRTSLRRPPTNLASLAGGHQATGTQQHQQQQIQDRHPNKAKGVSSSFPSSSVPRTQTPVYFDRGLTESPAELRVAKTAEVTNAQSVTIYPELDRYRNGGGGPPGGPLGGPLGSASDGRATSHHHPDVLFRLATEGLPPPTPTLSGGHSGSSSLVSGVSGSPSTRFSASPGTGPYSRDTTPTSMSSYSPSLVASARLPASSRMFQPGRARTGSFGRETPVLASSLGTSTPTSTLALAAIRESQNSSSSSNATAKMGDGSSSSQGRLKKKKSSVRPPSPPPRKSSQKFQEPPKAYASSARPLLNMLATQPAPRRLPAPTPAPTTRARTATTASSTTTMSTSSTSSVRKATFASSAASTSSSAASSSKKPQTSTFRLSTMASRSASQPAPPVRPSRKGTLDLHSQLGRPIPVIQSNLASAPLADRRASVALGSTSVAPPPLLHRQPQRSGTALSNQSQHEQPGRRSRSPSRPPANRSLTKNVSSTSLSTTTSATPSATISVTTSVTTSATTTTQEPAARKTRTPSPAMSTFRTRFPLFGRRTKTAASSDSASSAAAPEPKDKEKEKVPRKGPAAGTGHEGYGRLGAPRRRSGSAGHLVRSETGNHRDNRDSLSSVHLQDSFLRDRMSPVVIAGGEIIENKNASIELSRTDSSTSDAAFQSDSQLSASSREERATRWPSAPSRNGLLTAPNLEKKGRGRRPSDSSDSTTSELMHTTLAYRRSVQRLRSPGTSPVRLPAPIVIKKPSSSALSPSVHSLDTGAITDDSLLTDPLTATQTQHGRRGSNASSGNKPTPKKLVKRAKSPRRWNMFGRSQSQPASAKRGLQSSSTLAVTVEAALPMEVKRPVAFYTMLDPSEQEDGDVDIEDVLREARGVRDLAADPSADLSDDPNSQPLVFSLPIKNQTAPPPEDRQPLSAAAQIDIPSPPVLPLQPPTGRPRLAQVGRIPKVISGRREAVSPPSFSRPFHRASVQASPSLDSSFPSQTSLPKEAGRPLHTATPELSRSRAGSDADFLAFPPWQYSESTSYTTSRSSGILTFAEATAVVPEPNAPLVEDEIWDEYNDLMADDDLLQVPLSATSSQGFPFYLDGTVTSRKDDETALHSSPTMIMFHNRIASIDQMVQHTDRPPVPSSVYSSDMVAEVNEALNHQPSLPPPTGELPATPFSVSEFVSGYGGPASHQRAPEKRPAARKDSGSSSSSSSRRSAGRRTRASDGSSYSQVSEDNSPTAQVNLRVGSMSVSKWLTFGHVLFSPARDEMVPVVSSPGEHSVLVIDGLGNDDWSFYAAETYPAATFFNMSPRAPIPTDPASSAAAFPLSPPNHHQIQYLSHAHRFPFQSDMFTTVVYRFPPAAPESHYRNVLNESRRVLKPGGYLELSVLDLDLNNMGNRTRHAMRRLKEQMHARTPDVHLGSTSDAILRLLGHMNYTDIKSCRVGVPAASAISQSSRSEAGGVGSSPAASASQGAGPSAGARNETRKDTRSLAEMMSDQSPVADMSITNMVARVGRWWHSKCYVETMAGSGGEAPPARVARMWTNRALLAECEEWRTNLKLMVCYARVPDTKRVVSV